ncbi:hypothetical protein LWI29_034947 [Acer saccharum]|uniref:Uncharacterized protein n=1 Tax=Acer saccharum TaxID=4024 RepID=A0AA39TKA3_ACESA|nr:hypothetical protein LWI29_034947 [Acer saccharum]
MDKNKKNKKGESNYIVLIFFVSDSFTSVHSLSLSCLDLYQLFQRTLFLAIVVRRPHCFPQGPMSKLLAKIKRGNRITRGSSLNLRKFYCKCSNHGNLGTYAHTVGTVYS